MKALVRNKKNKLFVASVPATVHSIGFIPNTYVPSYTSVTMKKESVDLVKRGVFCLIVGYGTPSAKTLLPEFRRLVKPISEDRLSTSLLIRTRLISPFLLEPRFFNVKTVTWSFYFSMYIMTCLTGLMEKITLVPFSLYLLLLSEYCGTQSGVE